MDTGQRSWLASNHPSVVGRWARGLEKPKAGSSEESPNPKIQVLPRKSGPVRDFAGLSPGQFARHPGRTSEKDSMEEWGAEAIPGTRGRGKLNLESRNVLDPLAKRDVKQASRRP